METVIEVVGNNGDRVTLAGENAGMEGIWLAEGVEGLMDPEVDIITKSSGSRPGSRLVSHRIVERTIVFKVTIENDENDSWADRDDRWRGLWGYDTPTEIRVTTTRWGTRILTAYLNEIEVDTEYDPFVNGSTDVTMTVTAYDPFWYAEPKVMELPKTTSGNYTFKFDEDINPTPNPVFPEYVLEGKGTYKIPDGDTSIKLPLTLKQGEAVVVNTDPGTRQIVEANGVPVWARMNGVRWRHPLPAKSPVRELVVETTGVAVNTPAMLVVRQPFNRPWGAN